MTEKQKRRLASAGWKFGSTAEFLGLTPDEAELVEIKLALSRTLRRCREALRLSQQQLAKVLGSSQSRVAKMEAADPSVTVDLLLHALVSLGVHRDALGRVIGVQRVEDTERVSIRPRLPSGARKALRA